MKHVRFRPNWTGGPRMFWKALGVYAAAFIAVAAFVVLVGGFMLLRALGIGPAGSLLAAGKLAPSDKVIVATFDATGAAVAARSTPGSTIPEQKHRLRRG